MNTIEGKQHLLMTLKNTLIGDSQLLRQAEKTLLEASKIGGFCMALMELVDEASNPLKIKLAGLVQLKNMIKRNWNAKQFEIDANQKQAIKGVFLTAFVRCVQNRRTAKLYREVFTIIISHEFQVWNPVPQIFEHLKNEQDANAAMHALIAISSNFQFSISDKERLHYFNFLQMVLPELNNYLKINHNSEFIFLCIKFLWKAVHYEVNDEIKLLTREWMPLIHTVINSTNPELEAHIEEHQPRGTPQFFYFHSKKWATRIFLRYLQKHAKTIMINKVEKNKQFSDQWYAMYGHNFVSALINQFKINTAVKVRYFQLKCLQTLGVEKPELVQQYADAFQYNVLLPYMKLKPEDQQLADTDPTQFLMREEEMISDNTNLKRVAKDAWISFAEIGSKPMKKNHKYKPGVFFFGNMNFLKTKLESPDQVEKQMAMYIICQLRMVILRCEQVKAILPQLISKYVIPEFQNSIMFLRARAVQIFRQYGTMDYEPKMLQQAVQGIYLCLTRDESPLVRIKAASAFNCILKHKAAKDLVRPLLKDILTNYLHLLEKYDLQCLVNSLESIVEDFAEEIGPFAYELVKYLASLYMKLSKKDAEKSNDDDYEGEAEMAAASCLKTITQIIEAPITKESVIAIEPEVINLCEFVFSFEGQEYVEDILTLLNAYLFKIETISPNIWFFYQIVIYNVVGIPKEAWPQIEKLPMSEKHKAIFKIIKNGNNIEVMEQSMPVIRNYIRKGSQAIINNQDAFKMNLINLLFYLVNEVYRMGPSDFNGEIEMTCCTALLIYLLQNFQSGLPEMIYKHIWDIAKVNLVKSKSKVLKILNSQLLALLTWAAPTFIMKFVSENDTLGLFIGDMLAYEGRYEQNHESVRLALGLCTLLALPDKPYALIQKCPSIFKLLVKVIRKQVDDRLEDFTPNNQDLDDKEDSSDIEIGDLDEDEDFWEESYDDNYSSLLDQVDQIDTFRTCLERLSKQQPNFYTALIQTVPNGELQLLDQKVAQALSTPLKCPPLNS